MLKSADILLYALVLVLGLGGVALIEIMPHYMLKTALVYGGF